jgi:hypothetical protein
MDQTQYFISILQQQRNQALDALVDVGAQLNAMRDQLAQAKAEIARLCSSAEIMEVAALTDSVGAGFDRNFDTPT